MTKLNVSQVGYVIGLNVAFSNVKLSIIDNYLNLKEDNNLIYSIYKKQLKKKLYKSTIYKIISLSKNLYKYRIHEIQFYINIFHYKIEYLL